MTNCEPLGLGALIFGLIGSWVVLRWLWSALAYLYRRLQTQDTKNPSRKERVGKSIRILPVPGKPPHSDPFSPANPKGGKGE